MAFWKLFSSKKDVDFYDLLLDQAEKTNAGCHALVKFLEGEGTPEEISRLEREADDIRRILIDELHQTFITPIDREDIFALSRAIDDVLDYAYSTADEMEILKVEPTPYMRRIASLLRDAAYELFMAVNRLEGHVGVAGEHAQRAKRVLFPCHNYKHAPVVKAIREIIPHAD